MIKRIAVFCGSSSGNNEKYGLQTAKLGEMLAQNNLELVYGGTHIGLMGAVADGALRGGGKVTGVITRFLQSKEIAHSGLTEQIVVETMHQRKAEMNALADAFIALPGGFGTLEELFEVLTWAQLGFHQKPVALFNIDGFYDSLYTLLCCMVEKGFLKKENQQLLLLHHNMETLISQLSDYRPIPAVDKWITRK